MDVAPGPETLCGMDWVWIGWSFGRVKYRAENMVKP